MKKPTRPRVTRPPRTGAVALQIQRVYALELSRRMADYYQRLDTLEQEAREHGFNVAHFRYTRVLWAWVMKATPDALLDKINSLGPADFNLPDSFESQHTITVAKLHYLFSRAWFLAGLKYEKAHDATWYQSFTKGGEFGVAGKLDDKEFFDALAEVRQKRRLKKQRDGWGYTQYHILAAWLAGGLWQLPDDHKRAERLNRLLGITVKKDEITGDGFKTARKRLGLKLR